MTDRKAKEIDIAIVCEDSYGLDVYMIIMAINSSTRGKELKHYNILGVISDIQNPFGDIEPPFPIIGNTKDCAVNDTIKFVVAIREPKRKKEVVEELKRRRASFETIIAPWVLLPFEFTTGEGCIIGNYSCKYMSKFGDFVVADTVMCERVEVGDYSTLCPFSNITNAIIGREVYVGSHSVVMENRKIGDETRILPGSIVLTNIKPGAIVSGVPAKKIK